MRRTSIEVAFISPRGGIIRTIVPAQPDHLDEQGRFTLAASPTQDIFWSSSIVVDITNRSYIKHRNMAIPERVSDDDALCLLSYIPITEYTHLREPYGRT